MERATPHASFEAEQSLTFGELVLQPDGILLRGKETIHLAPKEFAALKMLLRYAGRIVTPIQLKEALWPDVHVTSDSVPRCISSLRSRLGAGVSISTIYKRGYRLDSPIHRHATQSMKMSGLPRLTILPFQAGMFVPEYLGPSIAENAAAHLRSLQPSIAHIIAPDSTTFLAGKGISPSEIGRRVGADLVLTGTVQISALFLRVRAEMLRMPGGEPLWAEEVLGARERFSALERSLLERISCRLEGRDVASISARGDELNQEESDPAAREAFLQGSYESRSRDPHRMRRALELLQKAAELEPNSMAARDHLVRVSVNQCLYGYEAPSIAAEQVRGVAETIPEIEEPCASVMPALGWVLFHMEYNLGFAQRMLDSGPGTEYDPWITTLRVMLALSRGRFDEAQELVHQALQDDPWSPSLQAQLIWSLHLAGKRRESLDLARTSLSMFSGNTAIELVGAILLAFNDDPNRAAELAHAVALKHPTLDIAAAIEAYALARANQGSQAREILERLQWLGRERYVLRAFTAAPYAELGDINGAISELQAAEEARCPWFLQTLADPRLKPLAGNPEFERMRRRLEPFDTAVPVHSQFLARAPQNPAVLFK